MLCIPAMKSTCIFKDTLRNDTQELLGYKIYIFEICLNPINFSFVPYFPTSSALTRSAGTPKEFPPDENELSVRAKPFFRSQLSLFSCTLSINVLKVFPTVSPEANVSDLFYVK